MLARDAITFVLAAGAFHTDRKHDPVTIDKPRCFASNALLSAKEFVGVIGTNPHGIILLYSPKR